MEERPTEPWSVCRTCMREAGLMSALYSDPQEPDLPRIAEMISTCTGLQVEKSDGLPEQVCESCLQTLNCFFQFRRSAERSDSLLRSLLAGRILPSKPEDSGVKTENLSVEAEDPDRVKLEPQDLVLPLDFLDDCLEHHLDEFSDEDKPLIKLEHTKTKRRKKIGHASVHLKRFCCTTCGKLFQKQAKLTRHELTHTNGKFRKAPSHNECEECFKIFKKPVHLKRHMTVHDLSRSPFLCTQCPQRFRDKGKLLAHLITHQGGSDAVKKELEVGAEGSEKTDVYHCAQCPEVYSSSHALAAHMRKHRQLGRVLACNICGKVFKKTSHLKRHERSHEDNRPFKCGLCVKSFALEDELTEHQNKHKGLKPHVCPVCEKAFSQRSTLTCHLRVHTRERPYLCPTCGKRFDSSTNLSQHQRRHAGVKAFACAYCPGRFVSKGELNSHMSTHTGARPFVCDTCGSSFTKPNSLAKHKLRHLGIKPHECDVCCTRFMSKEHLKRHYRIHTGEKPYRCELCERAFTQSNDLVKHKRAHLGENLYKCDQCTESFRLKTELRDHLSSHFIHSQVVAGVAVSLPPVLANKPPPARRVVEQTAPAKAVVVTQASSDTVLTVNKSELVQSLLSGGRRERLMDHVRNVPTAISVKRIGTDHTGSPKFNLKVLKGDGASGVSVDLT